MHAAASSAVMVHNSCLAFPVHRVYCVGKNYADHVKEMGNVAGDPVFFTKPHDAAHNLEYFRYPTRSNCVHYECELVVAIGKGGLGISRGNAMEHVFGFAVGIDFTKRDAQNEAKKKGNPWDVSKAFDYSAPLGKILPKEELEKQGFDLQSMNLEFQLNGVTKQSSSLSQMIWGVEDIISTFSELFELKPGDLIFTGTPAGVGEVVPGDVCKATITGLPCLELKVVSQEEFKNMNAYNVNYFDPVHSEEIVLETLNNCLHPRFKELLSVFIPHLHQLIKNLSPNEEEFMLFLEFLTRVGKICSPSRNEWLLIADILGASMLIDSINNTSTTHSEASFTPTESAVLGPFFGNFPAREFNENIHITGFESATPCLYKGKILDCATGLPIQFAEVEIWLTDVDGKYAVQAQAAENSDSKVLSNLSGKFVSSSIGEYQFRAIIPTSYPIPTDGPVGQMLEFWGRQNTRPAHIHFKISASGYRSVTTQIFVKGDPMLQQDPVFGVRLSLIYNFPLIDDAKLAESFGFQKTPFSICEFDFRLERLA